MTAPRRPSRRDGTDVKYIPGKYWDFWDRYLPLTKASMKEAPVIRAFVVDVYLGMIPPYTMVTGPRYPSRFCVRT